MAQERFTSNSLADTKKMGKSLGSYLKVGDVLAMNGELGAGKTELVRAIAMGLGLRSSKMVTSPTFVLINEYPTRPPLYHFDLYRLHSGEELFEIGAQEYFEGDGISIIEWAEKAEDMLPVDHLTISMTQTGELSRDIEVESNGPRSEVLLEKLTLDLDDLRVKPEID